MAPKPPERIVVDDNGVDITTGALSYSKVHLSIGSENYGLTLSGFYNSGSAPSWRDSFTGVVDVEKRWSGGYLSSITATASWGNQSWSFASTGGYALSYDGTLLQKTGNSVEPVGYKLTMRDGTVVTYTLLTPGYFSTANCSNPPSDQACHEYYFATRVEHPNGLIISPHYRAFLGPGGLIWHVRIQSVTNNAGYQIKFTYQSNSISETSTTWSPWLTRTSAVAVNNAVEYCDPSADTCSLSSSWPKVLYSNATSYHTVTDPLNRVTRYNYSIPSPNTSYLGVQTPGGGGVDVFQYTMDLVVVGYTANAMPILEFRTASAKAGSSTWTYSYAGDPWDTPRVITSTNPLSKQTVYTSVGPTGGWKLRSVKDPLNRTTSFADPAGQCWAGVVYNVTSPEASATIRTCDSRGNVTSTTSQPKPGSGLGNIVTSAAFSATCPATNKKICNQPTSTTDGRLAQTDYTYDANHGGVLTETLPAVIVNGVSVRPQKRYAYQQYNAYAKNSAGTLVQISDPVWMLTKISECRSSASCVGGADEIVTTFEYGAPSSISRLLLRGKVVTSGGVSLRTCYSYDSIGNRISVTTPRAGLSACPSGPQSTVAPFTTWSRYDAARQVVGVIRPNAGGGHEAIRNTYSADGQIIKIEQGLLNPWRDESVQPANWPGFSVLAVTDRTYDVMGRLLTEKRSGPLGSPTLTQRSYDAAGRLLCSAVRMNSSAFGSLPASACALGASGTQGSDRITYLEYDSAGQLSKEWRAYLTSRQQAYASYAYTLNGRIDWVDDANGNRTDFTYDGFDRVNRMNLPQTTVGAHAASGSDYEAYAYDGNSNRTSLRLRSGDTISYQFDALNRMSLKTVPGSAGYSVYYGYDLQGLNSAIRFGSLGGNGTQNVFDGFGRLTSTTSISTLGSLQLSYQYDADGNRTRLTWPDSSYVDYTYDGLDRMDQVRENGAASGAGLLADYSYDGLGRRSNMVRGNASATTYYYDSASRLTSLEQNLASTSHDLTLEFSYNPASQIVQRKVSNDAYSHFPLTQTKAYVPDGLNRYASVGGVSFGYDARGNLTSDGSRSFSYDLENHLLSVTGSGATAVNLTYDPMGRLWTSASGGVTTRYLYDGDRLVAEYNGSTIARRYAHGAGVDEPLVWYEGSGLTDRRWLHSDHQGSVVATSNGAGNGTAYAYSAYGEPAYGNWGGSRFRYTGQVMLPEAKLYHYKARVYDPVLGRFLQTDPVGYQDDFNLYAYVKNDPLNHTDPTGAIADTLVDIGFIAYDVYVLVTDPSWTNAGALGADIVGAAVPFATGLGAGVRAASKSAEVVRDVGEAANINRAVHGNSAASVRAQHRYEIVDAKTGEVYKTGISGQKLNKNGSSPRANQQVNQLNKNESGRYRADVKETGVPGRAAALEREKAATRELREKGNRLEGQCRPDPNKC